MSDPPNRPSAVFLALMSILRQNPDGLMVPELRRLLVRSGHTGVLERDIEAIVQAPGFRRLPGGRIILKEMEPTQRTPPAPSVPHSVTLAASEASTLCNLPLLDRYVVFDVETNGLDPASADFFQLSAIMVEDGSPVAAKDWYACVDTTMITPAIQPVFRPLSGGVGLRWQ